MASVVLKMITSGTAIVIDVCAIGVHIVVVLVLDAGMNPEIPGFCVKEKDLQSCYSTRDCAPNAKCVSLGRDGESYCVRRPKTTIEDLMDDLPVISVPSGNQLSMAEGGKGGLGTWWCTEWCSVVH